MAAAKLKNIDLQNPHLLNAPAKFTIAGLVVAGVFSNRLFLAYSKVNWKLYLPKKPKKSN